MPFFVRDQAQPPFGHSFLQRAKQPDIYKETDSYMRAAEFADYDSANVARQSVKEPHRWEVVQL